MSNIIVFSMLFLLALNNLFADLNDSVKTNNYFPHQIFLSTTMCSYEKFVGDNNYDLLLENNGFIPNNNKINLYGIGYSYSFPFFWTDLESILIARLDFSEDNQKSINDLKRIYESLKIATTEYTISYAFWNYFNAEIGWGISFIKLNTIINNKFENNKIKSDDIFDDSINTIELENNNFTHHLITGFGFKYDFTNNMIIQNIRIGLRVIYDSSIWHSNLTVKGTNQSISDINFILNDLTFSQIYLGITF